MLLRLRNSSWLEAKRLAAQPHRHPLGIEKAFQFTQTLYGLVKDGSSQRCVRPALFENVQKVRRAIGSARGDERYRHALRDRRRQRQVETAARAVAIHRSQQNLAR